MRKLYTFIGYDIFLVCMLKCAMLMYVEVIISYMYMKYTQTHTYKYTHMYNIYMCVYLCVCVCVSVCLSVCFRVHISNDNFNIYQH